MEVHCKKYKLEYMLELFLTQKLKNERRISCGENSINAASREKNH